MGEHPLLSVAFGRGRHYAPWEEGADQTPAGLMQRGCQASSAPSGPPGTRSKAPQLAVSPSVFRLSAPALERVQDPRARNYFSTLEKVFVPSGQKAAFRGQRVVSQRAFPSPKGSEIGQKWFRRGDALPQQKRAENYEQILARRLVQRSQKRSSFVSSGSSGASRRSSAGTSSPPRSSRSTCSSRSRVSFSQ